MGCSELKFRYICLSVFLVYSLVHSLSSVMYIVRSRKAISDEEMTLVNLSVEWTVFRCRINSVKESMPCGHIRRISSMNLFHKVGCK